MSSVSVMRGTGIKTTIAPAGQKATQSDFLNTSLNAVTYEYFETMGMAFSKVAISGPTNQKQSRRHKPLIAPSCVGSSHTHNRLGRSSAWIEPSGFWRYVVIGVVSDAKYRSLREPVPPTVYPLWSTSWGPALVLHVRTRGRPAALIEPVRRALHAIDPRLPFYEVRTLAQEVEVSLWAERRSPGFRRCSACSGGPGGHGGLLYARVCHRRAGTRDRHSNGPGCPDGRCSCDMFPSTSGVYRDRDNGPVRSLFMPQSRYSAACFMASRQPIR